MTVPAGFSGWRCERCGKPCPSIPADLDAAQARCPHCHKWTAVWVPPHGMLQNTWNDETKPEPDHRPRAARGRKLFAHLRAVIENPNLHPDLRQIENGNYLP